MVWVFEGSLKGNFGLKSHKLASDEQGLWLLSHITFIEVVVGNLLKCGHLTVVVRQTWIRVHPLNDPQGFIYSSNKGCLDHDFNIMVILSIKVTNWGPEATRGILSFLWIVNIKISNFPYKPSHLDIAIKIKTCVVNILKSAESGWLERHVNKPWRTSDLSHNAPLTSAEQE